MEAVTILEGFSTENSTVLQTRFQEDVSHECNYAAEFIRHTWHFLPDSGAGVVGPEVGIVIVAFVGISKQ